MNWTIGIGKMNRSRHGILYGLILLLLLVSGCGSRNQDGSGAEPETIAPVTVTHVQYRTVADTLTVNGQVMEGQQFTIRAPVSGYVNKLWVHAGQKVRAGQTILTLQTREQAVLDSDTSQTFLPKPGDIRVKAPVSGQITSLSSGLGVYAVSGSSLAMMASGHSLYLQVYVPLRWRKNVRTGDSALVRWADGSRVWARVGARLALADRGSQSVLYMIAKVPEDHLLPGERVTVEIPVRKITHAQVLPSEAVLTDESMSSWWVMKMLNDTTAVRVDVDPAITSGAWIAIKKPEFKPGDQILTTGNYGLADTARVRIIK